MIAVCFAMWTCLQENTAMELELQPHHLRTSIGYARPVEAPTMAPAESMEVIDGNACAEGAEILPCIYEPGVAGLVKVELTAGERATLVLKSAKGRNSLAIRSGNTLLLNLPADATLSLVGVKNECVQVHWTFRPRH